MNADLLVVSAMTQTVRPGMAKDPETKMGSAIFLYEIKSKRQVVLTPPNVFAQDAEWSRDGLQIFFTDSAAGKASSIWRIFWDGSSLKRLRTGSSLVPGP
jgi:Tol biopolymer transport system component